MSIISGFTWRGAVCRRLFSLELVVELGEVSQDGETVRGATTCLGKGVTLVFHQFGGKFRFLVIYHVNGVEKGGDSKLLFSKSENELAVPGEGSQINTFLNIFQLLQTSTLGSKLNTYNQSE